MNIYKAKFKSNKICVCIVDDTHQYNPWHRELVKNRADYTISNCTGMGYDVLVSKNEDKLLRYASTLGYKIAIVISAGTEFINGASFFENHPTDFEGILGHILEGGDAYYGLHYQCYSVNLKTYKKLDCPDIGADQPFSEHVQIKPFRSADDIHDHYLPFWINKGFEPTTYKHKVHGWNLISAFLEADVNICAYDETLRSSKHYIYREGHSAEYVYLKYNYCASTHVHTTATGDAKNYPRPYKTPVTCLVAPANVDSAQKRLNGQQANIVYYDYNPTALSKVGGGILVDIINDPHTFVKSIPDTDQEGLVIDISNIFAYEGTAAFLPLEYRVKQENLLLQLLRDKVPNATVIFDARAAEGIVKWKPFSGLVRDLGFTVWEEIELPSWHQ